MKAIIAAIIGIFLGMLALTNNSALRKTRENFNTLAGYQAQTLIQLAEARKERDQFAAAFLKALAAEEACDEHFKATFGKRNYAGN